MVWEGMVKDSKTKIAICIKTATEKKASDLVLFRMREISSFTDFFFVCSGKSDRQVQAIAEAIEVALHREEVYPLGQEGKAEGRWVLMDYGDVIVHIFLEPVRAFYDLEGLWIDAPRIDLEKGETLDESSPGPEKRVG